MSWRGSLESPVGRKLSKYSALLLELCPTSLEFGCASAVFSSGSFSSRDVRDRCRSSDGGYHAQSTSRCFSATNLPGRRSPSYLRCASSRQRILWTASLASLSVCSQSTIPLLV